MKKLKQKIFILLLSFSNLAVLSTVFYTYFNNQQNILLFSVSENQSSLEKKVEKECKKYVKELVEGKRSSFICNIKLDRRQKGAFYHLRTKVEVRKKEGGGFAITGQGRISNPTRHATTADFCGDCKRTDEVRENNFSDIMKQVLVVAETVYSEAQDSVQKARITYNKRSRDKRMAELKEQHCHGRWDSESENFEEFDLEGRLECKMNRLAQFDLPLDIEKFYHGTLKNDLWQAALSEDNYVLEDILPQFNDPYKYTFSVRASSGLLTNYLNWKPKFDTLDSVLEKERFVRSIRQEVNQTTQYMTKDQAQKDFYYLNKGLDGALARLNKATSSLPRTPAYYSPSSD